MVPKVVTGKILETLELRAGFPEGSKHSARDPSQCWTKSGASGRRHIPGCVVSTRARLSAAQFLNLWAGVPDTARRVANRCFRCQVVKDRILSFRSYLIYY